MPRDYLNCGVELVRGVHGEYAVVCGRESVSLCYDCATSLCSGHRNLCERCVETFCPSCLSFHREALHLKPAQPEKSPREKKSAKKSEAA